MQNFNWSSFTKKIAIKAGINILYSAWTIPSHLESWFLEKVRFYDDSTNEYPNDKPIRNGLQYEWRWFLYDDPMHGKVIQANGHDFLQFTFEGECLVDVKLEQAGEYTIVTLTHHNIPEDDKSKQYIRLGCSNGWTFYLTNLKSVYEGGIDLRNKEEQLGAMINN